MTTAETTAIANDEQRRLAELVAWRDSAPHPDDQPSPKAQERAWADRQQRMGRWRGFEESLTTKEKRTRQRVPLVDTQTDLLAAKGYLENLLANLADDRDRFREVDAAKAGLDALRRGI